MRRRRNEIIYNNPPPGFRDSLVAAFVVGIIVLFLMWYFEKSIVEILVYAYAISAIGRTFFSSNRAGSRLKRGQRA
jgi:hypothetical protein